MKKAFAAILAVLILFSCVPSPAESSDEAILKRERHGHAVQGRYMVGSPENRTVEIYKRSVYGRVI